MQRASPEVSPQHRRVHTDQATTVIVPFMVSCPLPQNVAQERERTDLVGYEAYPVTCSGTMSARMSKSGT
jgi:hypothetical protein